MPTNFPTGVDNFTNPTANDSLNLPSHSTQHANANDAIEAVEDYLLNGAGKTGLVHLHTTDTTTTTAVNIDNVFTSAYKNYRIVISVTATNDASTIFVMKLRAGGSTVAGSSYKYAYTNINTAGTASTSVNNGTDNFLLNFITSTNGNNSMVIDLNNPQINTRTTGTVQVMGYDSTWVARNGGLFHDAVQQIDGMRLEIDGGSTITYTLQIFGYRNA
jgi:hypothetical protein